MSVPMRKPHTDSVNVTFAGPAARVGKAIKIMQDLGFQECRKALPWREALGYQDEELPGVFLAGARYREELTQVQLAERAGIPRRHISEMENNKRPIGKSNAKKLGKALGVDPRRFLMV